MPVSPVQVLLAYRTVCKYITQRRVRYYIYYLFICLFL